MHEFAPICLILGHIRHGFNLIIRPRFPAVILASLRPAPPVAVLAFADLVRPLRHPVQKLPVDAVTADHNHAIHARLTSSTVFTTSITPFHPAWNSFCAPVNC